MAHSLGGLVVARALLTELIEASSDPQRSIISKVAVVAYVAPAFQLSRGFPALASTWGWGPLGEMKEFSSFRTQLNDDLRRARFEYGERFAALFLERSVFLLASDDAIVDNAATRAHFKDGKFYDVPGDHTGVLKIETPVHETFKLLEKILRSPTPIQIVQLPRRLESEIDADTGEVSDDRAFFGERDIAIKLVLKSKRRAIESVKVAVTPGYRGFYAESYRVYRSPFGEERMIRVLREPTHALNEAPWLEIWLNGQLFKRLPIVARGDGISAYRDVVTAGGPDLIQSETGVPRIVVWKSSGLDTDQHVDKLLEMDVEGAVRVLPALAQTFVEYMAGEKLTLALRHRVDRRITEGRTNPIVLKWLGISGLRSGDVNGAYGFFRELSQYDSIGLPYAVLTLDILNRMKDVNDSRVAAIEALKADPSVRDDLETVFGHERVTRVLGGAPHAK